MSVIRKLLAALALAGPLTATPAEAACITVVYEHDWYKGAYRVIEHGLTYNMDTYFNNRASSLRVGCGAVTLAAGFWMNGSQVTFGAGNSIPRLAWYGFDNQTSSVFGRT